MIDKMMKKYGYDKTEESYHGAYYKKREPEGYDHVGCVLFKFSGDHLMQSYNPHVFRVEGQYVNDGVGVEIQVLLLMWMKAKYLGIKYHWKRKVNAFAKRKQKEGAMAEYIEREVG